MLATHSFKYLCLHWLPYGESIILLLCKSQFCIIVSCRILRQLYFKLQSAFIASSLATFETFILFMPILRSTGTQILSPDHPSSNRHFNARCTSWANHPTLCTSVSSLVQWPWKQHEARRAGVDLECVSLCKALRSVSLVVFCFRCVP